MTKITFSKLTKDKLADSLNDLAEILLACVERGASVSFIQPFDLQKSTDFWSSKVFPQVEQGGTILLAAEMEGRLVGTVQLQSDLPPNQAHRCEVAKLLVHPAYRKQGIATTLMELLEEEARAMGKSLITLDTRSGDQAEPLYIMLDYRIAGRIPNFARATNSDRLDSTTYMYKILS